MGKSIGWDVDRDRWLKRHRRCGFAQIVLRLEAGDILDILLPRARRRHPGQGIFVAKLRSAACLVPFSESGSELSLRDILPDPLATKRYLGRDIPAPRRLGREERGLCRDYRRGLWRPVGDRKREVRRYRTLVRAVLQKRTRVNIRISAQDLEAIQQRALEEGLPYQTLISSLLHKYVTGRLRQVGREG